MANTELITIIIDTTGEMFTYMLPILGVMTGIVYITSFILHVTIGAAKRSF